MAIILTDGDDIYSETVVADIEVEAVAGDDSVTILSDLEVLVRLYGGAGNDELTAIGREIIAELYGDDGDDTLIIEETSSTSAFGGAGDDYIRVDYGNAIYGGDGNDVLDGGYITRAYGGAGDDIIYGYIGIGEAGSDIIFSDGDGGDGDDKVYGEFASGGAGDDELLSTTIAQGDDGYDLLLSAEINEGGAGKDVFFPFANVLEDGAEDGPELSAFYDIEDFEPGTDKIAVPFDITVVDEFSGCPGEAVFDELYPNQFNMLVDRDGDGVADILWYTGRDTYSDADFVRQTFDGEDLDVDDVVRGSSRDELMLGRDGDDRLDGAPGSDWLFGGFGDDVLNGGAGDDLLVGNAGHDRLYGGTGNDELRGGDGDDVLSASSGDDWLEGGAGNDKLAGGDGADTLIGGDGKDHLSGGAGDDVIIGGAGADNLWGGDGADRFVFAPGSGGGSWGERDQVFDFEPGKDKIDLTAFNSVFGVGGPTATETQVHVIGGYITKDGEIIDGDTYINIRYPGGQLSPDIVIWVHVPVPLFDINDILL